MKTEATKNARSVEVHLPPDEISKIIKDCLAKEGFEVQEVKFKVGSHLEGIGRGERLVYTFDGCTAKCRTTANAL